MGKALDDIKKELNNSPMYNLSLTSKELFHSNLLAWLGNTQATRAFFAEIIKELTGICLNPKDNWKVEREDKNFDLCVKEGKNYLLVIENKVKSIPKKKQLDEYVEKKVVDKNTKFLLLTLVNEFPYKDNVDIDKGKGGRWKIKTYKDLANAMCLAMKRIPIPDNYYKSILVDYIGFINNLNELVESWKVGINDVFAKTTDLKGLKKMSDLYAKIQYSSYCIEMQKKILGIANDIEVYDWGTIPDKLDNSKIYILVDWGFASTRKEGLLDVAIPVTNLAHPKIQKGCAPPDYVIKIQVEGRTYCHVIESFEDPKIDLVTIGKSSPYTWPLQWFVDSPASLSPASYGNDAIFDGTLFPEKHTRRVKAWPFKSYENKKFKKISFIYQNKILKEGVKANDVLENIVKEVNILINGLS